MKTYLTHSGRMHLDEILGYAIVKLAGVCNKYIRDTKENYPNDPDKYLIADTSREYSPEKHRYDHHQEFLTRDNKYPLASSGLLWRHFGIQAIQNLLPNSKFVKQIHEHVDKTLMQWADAIDADTTYTENVSCSAGYLKAVTLADIVDMNNCEDVMNHQEQRKAFNLNLKIVENVLFKTIERAEKKFKDIEEFDKFVEPLQNGKILFVNKNLGWRSHVHKNYPNAIYVINPSSHKEGQYSMIAVTEHPNSRTCKLPIERSKEFKTFIHQGKWIAGGSKEDLINLAKFNLNRKSKIKKTP